MNKLIIILSLMIIAFSQCKSQTLELVVDRGSVVDNFIGGNTEFYNVFRSKIRFPAELKSEKIIGNVYFEIEIDTTGNIIDRFIKQIEYLGFQLMHLSNSFISISLRMK